ncbi:1199_t:CDS:2, partial [Racocetra fulgida]
DEIIMIYENADHNKVMCRSLVDRVDAAYTSIRSLLRRQEENEEKFRDQSFYDAFYRFVTILELIKGFIHDISKISRLRKFLDAKAINDKFDSIILDLDQGIQDLNLSIAIYNFEELDSIKKSVLHVRNENALIIDQVRAMASTLEEIEKYVTKDSVPPNITDIFKAPEIDSRSLQEPPNNKDNDLRGSDSYGNGKVSRKFYQG